MFRTLGLTTLITGSLALLALALPASAPANPAQTTVKIGLPRSLFPGVPAALLDLGARPFRTLVETQTGLKGNAVLFADGPALGRALKVGEADLGVFPGIDFARAHQANGDLEPLTIIVGPQRVLRAHLVVRKACKAATMVELKGTVAVADGARPHTRLFLERRVPASLKVVRVSDAEEALEDVIDGKAQATVVDGVTLAAFAKSKPGRARHLRTLVESEAFPTAVLVAQRGKFSDAEKARLRDGLVNARNDRAGRQMLGMLKITAFEPVPADYLAMCDDIARAYPAQ